VRELRGNLTRYLSEARQGTPILVTSHDSVIAEIRAPSAELRPARQQGALRGQIRMAADFDTLPIQPAHLATLATLPQHHRDPFDHLLIAQAISEDVVFVSDDRNMPHYEVRLQSCCDA